jgi:hypothetical protein
MKKLNKFFAVLVALAMMATLCVSMAFAEKPADATADISKTLSLPVGTKIPGDTYTFRFTQITNDENAISDANAQNYIWAKVGEEHSDARGKWKCIPPTKPGVESIDYATYTITESARYANRNQAGKMCAKKLNKIGTPSEDFGLGGSWKCDDATVSWTGEYWLATLTWTRAGGSSGWDEDLYE